MAAALRDSGDEILRMCLAQALAETRGAATSLVVLDRRPFAYETSFAIDELLIRLDDGDELRLLVKDVGAAGLSALAASAKPPFLAEPAREIAVYRDILAPAVLSTPRFHGASVDADEGRWWLFVERVDGEVLTDVGEISTWRQVAAWLGELPAATASKRPAALESLLVHREGAWHARWLDGALAVWDASDADDAARRLAERLRPSRDGLLERLDGLPRAFVHGEFYASNVVVERGDDSARIAPVDWELAGTGPYALDLAALVSGWSDEARLAMCRDYHASLAAASLNPAPTFEALLEAVSLCRLALALQWIGWAPSWRPPEEHRHDWVGEAAELLDEVGLP